MPVHIVILITVTLLLTLVVALKAEKEKMNTLHGWLMVALTSAMITIFIMAAYIKQITVSG